MTQKPDTSVFVKEKNMGYKHVMHSLALVTLLLFAPSAVAQTTFKTGTSEQEARSSAGTGDTDASEEIIVTARRRNETAQDIPIAVSVIGGDQIDNTGSFNVGRLQQLTPTLQFYSSNPRNTSVNIRGIGVPFGLTNDGIEQGVGIYVDDVYYSRVASATFDFLDVAQIEVLRGPQGTLYGKNTTAGAINITTRQPTFDLEGRAEFSIGNLGFEQAKAAVSGPLSDTIAARVAISASSRNGTIFNVATNNRINEQNNLGVRGQLLWRPNDDLDVTLSGDFSVQNPECCSQIYVRTGATQRAVARQYAALAAAQNYRVISTNPFDRLTDVDANLNARNELGGTAMKIKWDTGAGTLTSVTAWRYWDWVPSNDRDFTGLPITTRSENPSQQEQYTQEIRYAQSGDRFDFLIGGFGYHQKVRTQGLQVQGLAASRWLLTGALANDPSMLNNLTARNDIRLDNTSAALFGQFSWKPMKGLTIQPGFRVNYDKKEGLYDSVVTNGAGQLVLFREPITNAQINDARIVAQRGVLAPQRFEPEFSDWNFSYDLTLSYEIADNILAYATYAKSFKSGGINLNGVPTDAAGHPILAAAVVSPESVNHYEAGLKAQFWDRKVTLNLAAFSTDIGNYQALVTNGQLGVLRGYLANADKVRTQGIEADFSVRPSEQFNVYLNGTYVDAKYRSFVDAPCPPELSGGNAATTANPPSAAGRPGTATSPSFSPDNCNISGQRLPGVSKWAFSYGAEANTPTSFFGHEGQLYVGVDGNYRTAFSSNPTPSIYTNIEGYALTNYRVGFRADSGLNIFGFVRNLFDVDYFEQLAVPSGNTGLIVGQPGDPRTYGVTFAITF